MRVGCAIGSVFLANSVGSESLGAGTVVTNRPRVIGANLLCQIGNSATSKFLETSISNSKIRNLSFHHFIISKLSYLHVDEHLF